MTELIDQLPTWLHGWPVTWLAGAMFFVAAGYVGLKMLTFLCWCILRCPLVRRDHRTRKWNVLARNRRMRRSLQSNSLRKSLWFAARDYALAVDMHINGYEVPRMPPGDFTLPTRAAVIPNVGACDEADNENP